MIGKKRSSPYIYNNTMKFTSLAHAIVGIHNDKVKEWRRMEKMKRYMVATWPQRGLRINKSQLRELIPGGAILFPGQGTGYERVNAFLLKHCRWNNDDDDSGEPPSLVQSAPRRLKFIAVYRSTLFPVNALLYVMTRKILLHIYFSCLKNFYLY